MHQEGRNDSVLTLVGTEALPLQVSVAGRLLDVSSKAMPTLSFLKKELVGQLGMLCSPASLQLCDMEGRLITSDEDLQGSLEECRGPLRATLTTSALREMEQKKQEVDLHNGELTTIQWQLMIEQMTFLSLEIEGLVGQIEVLKGACAREVQQQEEAEAERRQELVEVMRKLTADRENDQTTVLSRMEGLHHAMLAEKAARDVADYQLEQRIEQLHVGLNAESNSRERAHEEMLRLHEALRKELDLEAAKNAALCRDIASAHKRLQLTVEEHLAADAMHKTRLTRLEAESDKQRCRVDALDTNLLLQGQALEAEGRRFSEEFRHLLRAGAESWGNELVRLAEDTRASHLEMEDRMRSGMAEVREIRLDGEVRFQALEERCATLEKASQDALVLGASLEKVFAEKAIAAAESATMTEATQKNSEAWLDATRIRLDDLARRTHAVEQGTGERFNSLREASLQLKQEQDMRLLRIEEEVSLLRENRALANATPQEGMDSGSRRPFSVSSVREAPPTSPGLECTFDSLTASPSSTEPSSRRRFLALRRIDDDE
mmetsp:Transcript_43834/g.103645  ORF Transcript_43834/g.103645 Transcript_43834/m.103645 type:complete len:549 (+) Transcript_43834:90-1736(+)